MFVPILAELLDHTSFSYVPDEMIPHAILPGSLAALWVIATPL